MIGLDSDTWKSLRHAYGEASDIPDLLVQLADYPGESSGETEPYFSLWSALCHQHETCSAAYAAVPHVLALASAEPTRINYQYLLLPTSIEIARLQGRGPDVPDELELDYFRSIQSIPNIVARLKKSQLDETMTLCSSAGIAITGGYFVLAEAILELEGESASAFLAWKADL